MNITTHKQIGKSYEWMPSVFVCVAKKSLPTGQRQKKYIAMSNTWIYQYPSVQTMASKPW
jgi:hypothetical protein